MDLDQEPSSPTISPVVWMVGIAVVVLGLIAAAFWFPAAARAISPQTCDKIGGTWQPNVIGHGGYCDTRRAEAN